MDRGIGNCPIDEMWKSQNQIDYSENYKVRDLVQVRGNDRLWWCRIRNAVSRAQQRNPSETITRKSKLKISICKRQILNSQIFGTKGTGPNQETTRN